MISLFRRPTKPEIFFRFHVLQVFRQIRWPYAPYGSGHLAGGPIFSTNAITRISWLLICFDRYSKVWGDPKPSNIHPACHGLVFKRGIPLLLIILHGTCQRLDMFTISTIKLSAQLLISDCLKYGPCMSRASYKRALLGAVDIGEVWGRNLRCRRFLFLIHICIPAENLIKRAYRVNNNFFAISAAVARSIIPRTSAPRCQPSTYGLRRARVGRACINQDFRAFCLTPWFQWVTTSRKI